MEFILAILVVVILCLLVLAKKGKKSADSPVRHEPASDTQEANFPTPEASFQRRALMTENEIEFFQRLTRALPEHYIFPQVAMAALIEAASSDKKQAHSDRLRIAQQRADYVICNAGCEVIAVVELDDRTHSATKDQMRDSRLEQGGIRTIRFQSRNKPTAEAIRATVLPEPAPSASPGTAQPASATSDFSFH